MKVIFMGTPEFSVGTLKALIEADMRWCWQSRSRISQKEEAAGCSIRR